MHCLSTLSKRSGVHPRGGGGGGGAAGPSPCMQSPPASPPPGVVEVVGLGVSLQWRSIFFMHASLSSNDPCFERQICKTGRYTKVICCEVKILHSELFPSSHAVPSKDEKALLSPP